jgi:hypothetical protein
MHVSSQATANGSPIMTDPKYKAFTAPDPFFGIVQQGCRLTINE